MEKDVIQRAIEVLVLQGYIILQIVQPNNNVLFFLVYRFQEAYFNTAQSIDFNSVEGVNITEFIEKYSTMFRNHNEFLRQFNEYVDKSPILGLQFSKKVEWYKWAAIK